MFKEEYILCCQILRENFGPIVEKIGSVLLQRQRVNLSFLLKESGVSRNLARQALSILIQHLIVTYFETPENKKNGLEVANLVLTYGLLSVNQLSGILLKKNKTIDDINSYKKIMLMLVKDRIIVAATKEFVPPTTKQLDAIRQSIVTEIKIKANSRVIYGTKRKLVENNTENSKFKKQKFNESDLGEEELDDSFYFYLCFDRMDVFLRNHQLSLYMNQATNLGGSTVMKTLLEIAEHSLKSCQDNKTITISTAQIVEKLPLEPDIEKLIILENNDDSNPYYKNKKTRRNEKLGECVYSFLELLSNDKSNMLIKTDGNGPGQYYVDFQKGIKAVRKQQLNSFVRNHLGIESLRLLNVISKHNYVDDKTLAKLGMMQPSKCREKLMELSTIGFIEIQEIHKSSDRAPIRTIYLYTVDHNRQRAAFLKLLYDFSSKLIQRRDYEIMLKHNLLIKCNRDDVSHDLSLLSASDKENLSKLENSYEKLQTSIFRIDSIILIFRDCLE
ncbi:hypothetical protein BB561_000305 [Smittium simulii]|uniref:DNA-directed RNA polymerase III subunit RPC3 n=1 Tax=Smittium simulii TaxID=133385 RepID=A0A2T9YZW7_9FUNG|nr:hypothetical protein BB561_000305 [Smittium simulii]